jgi:hypothetical protein
VHVTRSNLDRPARRRRRFAAWLLLVIALLPGQCAWLILTADGQRFPLAGVVVGELLIGLMGALLATTPPDAIRLRRGTSEAFILAGTAALQASGRTGAVYAALSLAACGLLLWILRRTAASPWWAAPLAWNPILPLAASLAIRSAA